MSKFTRAVVLAVLSLVLPCALARGQDVKYEKYTLPNGLTVILHEDHALPVATINLWYYVGAKEEPARRSGFAHLFEHLMFMGTKRVPGSDFDNIMEAGGGSNNASTSLDRTNYFSSGPAELLPTLLWLDADRQEDLGRFMTKEKLDLQRDVVRNEIRQNVENTPYGRADDSMERLMYPATHPYFKGVYGTHEDLEAATVNDVRDFFANFYVPNNCSLVVAGDFDPAKLKPLIEKVFGSIPAGPKPNLRDSKDYPAPVLGRVVRSTMFDQVQLPRMTFVYHSPAHFAEGDAEMDLAGAVLAGGPSSRLYQRLVLKDKLAVEVSAYQASQTLSSLFFVTVMCAPDADLAAIERAVDEEVAKFVSEGPTADELSQRQAQMELGFLARLDSLAAKADAMNQYQYAFGEPNSFKRDLDRYRNATVAGVKEWAKRVLTPNSRAIVRVVPIDAEERAASGRDERPELAGAPVFTLTKPEEFTLANGIPVKLWQRKDLPLVAMEMQFHAGARKAAGAIVGPKESGVPSMLADMLDEGTKELDSVGFAQAIESQGATFGAGADQESLTVSVSGIKRNFEKSLALCGEAVCRPRLAAADFERVKRITLEDLNQSDADPQQVASRVATRMLFGDENPYAFSAGGTPTSVEAATLEKVKQLHAALLVPENASIMVAGDLSATEAKQMLEKALAGWKGSDAKIAATPIPATQAGAEGLRVVVVERPEAVQTVIRFIMPAPNASDPSRNTLRAVNTILGGSFTSRLNRNLREEHGYTYGAGSRFMMEATTGYFIASSAVKAEVTGAALAEFFRELERTRGGDIDQDEVLKATRTLRTDTIESLAGLHGVISQAASLESLGLPYSTISADMDQLSKLAAADLNSAAKTGIPLDRAVLVLVGDPTVVREALSQLQEGGRTLPAPTYVTPWGEPTTSNAETQTAKGE